MQEKIEQLLQRLPEVEAELGDPSVFDDKDRYKKLSQEHSYLSELKSVYAEFNEASRQLKDNRELLLEEQDPEMKEMLTEEITALEEQVPALSAKLETLLVPPDPMDHRNTIVELRAGTGGDEAAIFVGDCVRMYKMYAGKLGWTVEELSATESEAGGYKEYIMVVSGKNVFRFLQYEGGTHRVQRVPVTESQGRVHTSAITVAVLAEPDEAEEVKLDESELRIDTYRASGAGGQHVNTTDSAVRITHLPSGLVAYCSEERSQIKNRAKAMRLLVAKIAEQERIAREKEIRDSRSSQVGTGDRSERIRTYNFPQNRVTEHRINLTRYNLDQVMAGEMDEVIMPLVSHFHHLKLQER